MYKMLTLETEPAFRQLMQDEMYIRVANFFISQKSDVTLREIKRNLPGQKNIERKMESWIDMGVVSRCNGRYQLNGEILSKDEQNHIQNICDESFNHYLSDLKKSIFSLNVSMKDQSFYLTHALFNLLSKQMAKLSYIEDVESLNDIAHLPFYLQKLSGIKTTFMSYESLNGLGECKSLSSYFFEQRYHLNTESSNFIELNNKIGDVNKVYFMTYIDRKLRRIDKGRHVSSTSPDIFLEALEILNYLMIENDSYKLSLTVIEKDIEQIVLEILKPVIDRMRQHLAKEFGVYELLVCLDNLKRYELMIESDSLTGYYRVKA